MEAIRQFVTVKNHQINITLPEDFLAEEVEVIILSKEKEITLNDDMKSILDHRLQEPESEYITEKESIEKIKKKYGF